MSEDKNPNNYIKYRFLNPMFIIIPGVNTSFGFLETTAGRRDSANNQLCRNGDGYITPYVDTKVRKCDSYIDKLYLRTSLILEPIVEEAESLVVELNLLLGKSVDCEVHASGEEADRQKAHLAASQAAREKRTVEILTRISEIKGKSTMIDESLKHLIERVEGILHARISRYWRGILATATGSDMNHFPNVDKRPLHGRDVYETNRKQLIDKINQALRSGGGYDVVEEA